MGLNDTSSPPAWLRRGFFALVVITLLSYLKGVYADPDLWGYLAFGRLFWETRQFPYQDIFSYVPTLNPWIYHEWLTGVVFFPIYQTMGDAGLQALRYTLGLSAAWLIYRTARLRGADPVSAAILIWMIQPFLVLGYSPVRAQVFTYVFFAWYVYRLEQARLTGRWLRLWPLPVIMVFWANAHGGFPAGLGLIGFYALGQALARRPFWPYVLAGLAAGLATLINPYGLEYWDYMARAVTMPRPEITEWASIWGAFRQGTISGHELSYYLTIMVFVILLLIRARCREATVLVGLAVTCCLGVKHLRHQVFFLLLAGAYLPVMLKQLIEVVKTWPRVRAWGERLSWRLPALAGAALALIFAIKAGAGAPWRIQTVALPIQDKPNVLYYPLGALDYLKKESAGGNILLEFNWGEYVLWWGTPRFKVALDGRFETVYPQDVCQEYFDFIFARPQWRRFLEKYPPDFILLTAGTAICRQVAQDPAWRQVYHDSGAALFAPAEPKPALP
jgi:hypothetical protein